VPAHCSVCNVIVMQNQLKIAETVTRTKGFEMVGGVAFDGLTSMTDVVLDHMDVQRGEGLIGGEKAAFGGVVTSGSQKFGGNNRADVGFGQTRAHQFVNNSLSIPHLVEGPVFTALAFEATDEGGLPIVGAKLPGRAATDEASSWFGNVAETGKASDDLGKECFALYLRPFTDPQNRRHLLKTSASPTGVPDKLVDPAIEFNRPYSVVNLGSVFRMLDDDLRRSLLEEMPGAPGTPDGMVEYGEVLSAPAPAVVAAPMMGGIPVMGMPVPAPASAYPMLMAPAAVAAAVATPAPAPAPAPAETPASTPAAASLSAAAIAPPPAVLDGAARGSSGVPSGPPMMVAQPRKRRGAGQMAATSPIGPPAGLAAVVPPVPAAAPAASAAVASTPVPAPMPIATAPPSGAPPPPPGMRPPMKAPGS
jgi:hypothetical protein